MELTRRHYEKALQYFSTMLGKTFVLIHQELAAMYAASDKVEDIEHALLVMLNTYQAYQILNGLPKDEQAALNSLAPHILENIQTYLMRIIRGANKGAIKAKVSTFKDMYKEAIYNHDAPLASVLLKLRTLYS
ncbi:hypothetical protein THRCLA_23177 [Thraustotheca clavata]|uniref:Uncharacterized protein n=1 Tax=Thraustotheca clavata TaxID=74557 RepID=A0A1V9YBQ5_9STRA|nr:hypothetical protein THRCLA_23177 [Thraustotheca clavata]